MLYILCVSCYTENTAPTLPSPHPQKLVNLAQSFLYTYSCLANVLQYIHLLSFASLPITPPLPFVAVIVMNWVILSVSSLCASLEDFNPLLFSLVSPLSPYTVSPYFPCTHLPILYPTAVVLSSSPSLSCAHLSLPLSISASIPFSHSESITQITIMLSDPSTSSSTTTLQ